MAFASLTIANANAGSAVVVSSNGYYAAAWGQFLNADQAMAKASELCQKKGGTDIKVLLSRTVTRYRACYFVPLLPPVMDPARLLEQVMGLYHLRQTVRLLLTADKKEAQVLTS